MISTSIIRGLKSLERTIANNSSTILTGVGVAGVFATGFLSVKATFKAAQLIQEEEVELADLRTKANLVWKEYIPTTIVATTTVAAIIFANRVSNRRAAALALAYTVTEKAYDEYRDKVLSKFGSQKEEFVRSEIARERVNRTSTEVIMTGGGDVLCFDSFTGRIFHSDMETLRRAENDINAMIISDFYASLSDFYSIIGLPSTSYSDEVGWNTDKMLKLRYSASLTNENVPCINVDFGVTPVRHFNRIG